MTFFIVRKRGSTSNVLRVKLRDTSSSAGAGLTGLTFSSSGLSISTICDNEATATTYTAAASKIETISTLGTYAAPTSTKCRFKEVDATNHPGLYEIQIDDARFNVSSSRVLRVTIKGAANLFDTEIIIQITSFDLDTAMPAYFASMQLDASGFFKISTGSGPGQIDLDTGIVPANLTAINGDASLLATVAQYLADNCTNDGFDNYSLASIILRPFDNYAPTAENIATATAAQITIDHGSGSYVRNTEPLDAAGTRSALGMSSADLDTQLDAILAAIASGGLTETQSTKLDQIHALVQSQNG